jgi:hypothetical protein
VSSLLVVSSTNGRAATSTILLRVGYAASAHCRPPP